MPSPAAELALQLRCVAYLVTMYQSSWERWIERTAEVTSRGIETAAMARNPAGMY